MNENLAMAIELLSDEMILNKIPIAPDHKFSKRFEKRMRKIIAGNYSPNIRITPRPVSIKRLSVCLIAALLALITFAMSVSAVRETIINFFTQVFTTHTVVKSESDDVYPETIEEFYEIADGLDGYEIIDIFESPYENIIDYDNGKSKIRYKQIVKGQFKVNINTEGYELIPIKVGEHDGYYVDITIQKIEYLSFDNGSYDITILVTNYDNGNPIGQNALIDMANSVQKVEN
jgi:hypothetical protein